MRCPTLTELPPPPPGKTDWPWTEESEQLPDRMPDGEPWPKVSIVTPSYNQAQFIEETIRSVLLQGYPNLEYIIVDGGSTDDSVDVIRKYEKWLAYWVSEPDQGQSDAINKGFRQSDGDILAWLNSDDLLQPSAIGIAAAYLSAHPQVGMVYGDRIVIDSEGDVIRYRRVPSFVPWQLRYGCGINQETAFWRRQLFFSAGELDASLQYAMDYDLWWRFARLTRIHHLPILIARYRAHQESKSVVASQTTRQFQRADRWRSEGTLVRRRHMGRDPTWAERTILPRIRGALTRLERLLGRYNRRRAYVQRVFCDARASTATSDTPSNDGFLQHDGTPTGA